MSPHLDDSSTSGTVRKEQVQVLVWRAEGVATWKVRVAGWMPRPPPFPRGARPPPVHFVTPLLTKHAL